MADKLIRVNEKISVMASSGPLYKRQVIDEVIHR
jgi:hypothetical protein